MFLMAFLGLVVVVGVVLGLRWGRLDIATPWSDDAPPEGAVGSLQRFLWYVTVGVVSGIGAGVIMMGAGGRLAMRLLAVTAGDEAQGGITEAEEIVGRITFDGTTGFVIFFGVFGGVLLGLLYVTIQHWLPRGSVGGFAYGALLLAIGATRIEPLRPDNEDFDIVGPGWLAVLVFIAIGLGFGILLAAFAGRYSRSLPLIGKDLRKLVWYAPLILGAPLFILLPPLAVAGGLAILIGRNERLRRSLTSRRTLVVGRAALLIVAAVSLPGMIIGIADILAKG
jgi:hypothetical protein